MKSLRFESLESRRAGIANGAVMALVAALAVGIGVTGTLLWTQNRAATTEPAPPAPPPALSNAAPLPDAIANLPIAPGTAPNAAPGTAPNAAPGTAPNASPNAVPNAVPTPATPPSIAGMSSGQAALTMGNFYYDQQKWPLAIASYRAALGSGFDNPDVRTDYGNALRFAGEPKKALEQYLVAQKQDPSHEQSLFNQGGLWAFALSNKPKGVAAWRAYLKRFPQGQSADQARQFLKENG